jgi:hypothetical protein
MGVVDLERMPATCLVNAGLISSSRSRRLWYYNPVIVGLNTFLVEPFKENPREVAVTWLSTFSKVLINK